VNSCVLEHFFLEGIQQPILMRHATTVTFSKFGGWRRHKKMHIQKAFCAD